MPVKWTICIATVPERSEELKRLMHRLLPQVDKFGGQIEVLVFFNHFEHTIGYYRQKMLDNARGEYISSIDDDDMVPSDFCSTIFPLLSGVDYIGFQVELRNDGKKLPPVYHSLKYNTWTEDENGYYRGVTHLNPLKTSIAKMSHFPEVVNGEDFHWTAGVHTAMAGKKFTERYIARPMYLYDHFGHEQMTGVPLKRITRPVFKSKNVRFHPESTRNGSVK